MVEGKRAGQPFEELVIMFKGPEAPGTYAVASVEFYFGGDPLQYFKNGSYNVSISEFGTTPGSYLAGTFSGTVRNPDGTKILPINCSFRVKRSQ